MTAADGSVTAYTYSGNTVTVTDPAGKWKTFTSDAFGNLTSVQEPNPDYQPSNPSYAPQYVYTIYTYDALNHLTNVAMTRVLPGPGNSPVTQNRSFVYDSNQRLWKATNPENGLVTYLYNNDGTLQSKTDAKGQQVTYSYNPGDMRVQAIDHLPAGANTSPDPCQHVALYWDVQLIPGGVFYQYGRLGGAATGDPSCLGLGNQIVEEYAYDHPGNVIAQTLQVTDGSITGSVGASYEYDNEGKLTNEYFADPSYMNQQYYRQINHTYDNLGRPNGMVDFGDSLPEADIEIRHLLKSAQLARRDTAKMSIEVVLKGDCDAGERYRRFFGIQGQQVFQEGLEEWVGNRIERYCS